MLIVAYSSVRAIHAALLKRGICAFKDGDLDACQQDMEYITEADEDVIPDAFNWLARVSAADRDWYRAIELNTKALDLDHENLMALQDRSLAYDAVGKEAEALQDTKRLQFITRQRSHHYYYQK